ncbi:hypothetical protein F2Q68_00017150 [Brassica cretica]|uniref:RNase H type-1 domain-containing protein n=1 Tax=Brassica cretica TaxID=69181 RepID=A0A8S9HAL7_BRACR|nr:hypothetical protein F2Q68_00017150 [Brassica cretica]
MEGLLWAVSCMRDRRITLVWFETDCSDLVDKTTNPMDWPSIATENRGVPEVTKGLPRYQTRTDGDAPRRIDSSVLHLI